MKRVVRFTARFEIEKYDDDRFWVLQAASREYSLILDTWGFDISLPQRMEEVASQADTIWAAS